MKLIIELCISSSISEKLHTHTHKYKSKSKAKFLAALIRSRYLANPGCLFTKQAQ